jgi:hypothetical protein
MHLPTPYFSNCMPDLLLYSSCKEEEHFIRLSSAFAFFPFLSPFPFFSWSRSVGVLELRRIRRGEGSERERKVKVVEREKGRSEKAGKKK